MADDKKPIVDYTDRDFQSIRDSLNRLSQQYAPEVNTDKSVANFATLLLDATAYVADVLSFNLDYSFNESMMDTAIQTDNMIRHSERQGYKFKGAPASMGIATFYIRVPVDSAGVAPDSRYMPIMRRGSEFSSDAGVAFILNEDIDFSNPNNEIRVSQVNDATGAPTSFVVRAYGQVVSGEVRREIVEVGAAQKFLNIRLTTQNITEIISVVDSNGNEWYEVPYLSQDVVYRPVLNRDPATNEIARNILKPFPVPRRFTVRHRQRFTELQFGHGSSDSIDGSRPTEPSNVALNIYGKPYVSDTSFDPDKLVNNDKLGVAPADTEIEVLMRVNTNRNVNVSPGRLRLVSRPILDFQDRTVLDQGLLSTTITSLQVDNDQEIVGDVTFPGANEFRVRSQGVYAAQNRAVTRKDYAAMAYNMPQQFGSIKRVNIVQDPDSFRRNMNMYVVAEGADGTFANANIILKQNLKKWLAEHKMIGDTIDILDAKIVNFGIVFTAVSDGTRDRGSLMRQIKSAVARSMRVPYEIGEPINISSIYKTINAVPGVSDTVDVRIELKRGGLYSDARFILRDALTSDGRAVVAPEDTVFEMKFPSLDIAGAIR